MSLIPQSISSYHESEEDARWNPVRLFRPMEDTAESGWRCLGDSLSGAPPCTRPLSSLTSSEGSMMSWKMLMRLSVRRQLRASLPDCEESALAATQCPLPAGEPTDSFESMPRPSLIIVVSGTNNHHPVVIKNPLRGALNS